MRAEELWQDLDWLAVAARRRGWADLARSGRTLRRVHWPEGGMLLDLRLTGMTSEVQSLMNRAAIAAGVYDRRAALFGGSLAAALRPGGLPAPALRRPAGAQAVIDGTDRSLMLAEARHWPESLAEALRDGALTGAAGVPFRDVIHLCTEPDRSGPQLAVSALAGGGPQVHLATVGALPDGLLATLDPLTTLVVLAAPDAGDPAVAAAALGLHRWLAAGSDGRAARRHIMAVTADAAAAAVLGVAPERIIAAGRDWLDGFGVWSPVDLALPIALGSAALAEFRAGAAEADAHFRTAPAERNLPVLLGFADLWTGALAGHPAKAVRATSPRLAGWPAFQAALAGPDEGGDAPVREMIADVRAEGGWSDAAVERAFSDLASTCSGAPGLMLAHNGLDARMLGRLMAIAEHRALVSETLRAAHRAPAEPGWRSPSAPVPAVRPATRIEAPALQVV